MLGYALLESGSRGNCCLIKSEQAAIVIDCGGTQRYLKTCFNNLNYQVSDTDALFITHTHSDHVSALNLFKGVDTYSSCLVKTDNFKVIDSYRSVNINDMQITVLPTSHDSFESCGYLIETGDSRLVYITDTGYVSTKVKGMIKNADYYIFESNHDIEMLMQTTRPMPIKQRILSDCGHLCNEDSAEVLCEVIGNKTREIVLAHISQEANTYQQAREVLVSRLNEVKPDYDIDIRSALQFEMLLGGGLRHD